MTYEILDENFSLDTLNTNFQELDTKNLNLTSVVSGINDNVTDLAQDVTDLTTVVGTKASKTQPVWINASLIAPTVNYGSGYQTCQYRKDEFGIVHIRGIVKGGVNGSTIFVLPVEYRPSFNELLPATAGNLAGICTIFSNGNVVQTGAGVATSFSFGNISFVGV